MSEQITDEFLRLGAEFKLKFNEFVGRTDELSKNSLKRAVISISGYPFEEDIVKLLHPEEIRLAEIGKELYHLKTSILLEGKKQDDVQEVLKKQRENNNG